MNHRVPLGGEWRKIKYSPLADHPQLGGEITVEAGRHCFVLPAPPPRSMRTILRPLGLMIAPAILTRADEVIE